MKKKGKRLISILLSLVMVFTLMQAVSLRAVADGSYKSLKNTTTVVKFDNKEWYLIDYDDSTVTLLAKECVAASVYNEPGYFVEYSNNPTVKSAVDNYYDNSISVDAKTAVSGGMFLLTTSQAAAITNEDVRKCSQFSGTDHNFWWLCSLGGLESNAAVVFGADGSVNYYGSDVNYTLAVRPALKLNLAYVDFASNTFTVNKYCPGITTLGTGAIANPTEPSATTDPWNGSYVYYGKYDGTNPTKYRVLDKASGDFGVEGGSLLLDCDSVLYQSIFGNNNSWAGSTVKAELNEDGFLKKGGNLTGIEKEAIASSTKEYPASGDGSGSNNLAWVGLSGEKVFLLDTKEVTRTTYGYSDTSDGAKNRIKQDKSWWLRSPYHYGIVQNGHIPNNGTLSSSPANKNLDVSPAFNVSLSSVIFSSLISGTFGSAGAEYKLTLKDPNLTIAAGTISKDANYLVSIPYTITDNSTDAEPAQLSVVVTDGTWTNNGWSSGTELLQYTKLNMDTFALTGTGTFTLDSSINGEWGSDYHVYVLAEDVNGEKETDYASAPIEVALLKPAVTPPTANTLTYTGSEQELVTAGTVVGGEMQYVIGADATTAPTSGWSEAVPKETAAGTYYVWFMAKGDTTHSDSTPGCVTVIIKNKPSPPSPGPGPSPSYTYYTVKFEMNGHGEQVSSQTVRSGSKAKRPEDPTAEEYYFAGWFEDAELTTEYDFSSAVKKNMTLYARWEEIRYTVSFDLDGKGSIETQWVRKNGIAGKPDDPSAEGFTFGGWYLDSDCKTPYDFSTPVTKDITVYAKWVKDVSIYRLYNPNSGAHLFTSNGAEKDSLVVIGWEYEGVAWTAPESSNTPVYRVYNPNSGEHHYTMNAAEKDILVTLGWDDEGICWYSDEKQGTPLYRLYNPNATGQYAAGAHHYTKDVEERDYLIAAGWNDEGIGWYGK